MGPLRLAFVVLVLLPLAAREAPAQTPMSQCSVLSHRPCHPSFCGVFHRGPCMPYYQPPIGQDLRLTVVSTDNNEQGVLPDGDAAKTGSDQASAAPAGDGTSAKEDRGLDSIRAMFAALRACWVPPPKIEALHGMQYTVRFAFKRNGEMIAPPFVTYASRDVATDTIRNVYHDAVAEALARCAPLHFTDGMAGAVAGRPIAVRFVDDRTTDRPVQ